MPKNIRVSVLLSLLLCMTVCAASAQTTEDGSRKSPVTYTCTIDGTERSYRLYIPDNLAKKAPLVFVLHGYGSSFNLDHYGMNSVADRYGFAVCYPQGTKDSRGKRCWNVGYPFQADMTVDDVSFLCKLAAMLQKRHGLSRRNTFCTGMSNGGEMCYLLAYRPQKTFAAVAPIAGLTMAWMPQKYDPHPIPLLEIHGTEDRTSEWTGDPDNDGGWGAYLAVPEAIGNIAACNGCDKMSETDVRSRRNPVTAYRYYGGKRGYEVWLYKIEGGGHSWGDKDIDTAEEIWKFFSTFAK